MKGNLFAALSNVRPSHLLDLDLRQAVLADQQRGRDEHVL